MRNTYTTCLSSTVNAVFSVHCDLPSVLLAHRFLCLNLKLPFHVLAALIGRGAPGELELPWPPPETQTGKLSMTRRGRPGFRSESSPSGADAKRRPDPDSRTHGRAPWASQNLVGERGTQPRQRERQPRGRTERARRRNSTASPLLPCATWISFLFFSFLLYHTAPHRRC
jgi:hypothetical protein